MTTGFDTGTHESFFEYYRRESLSPATLQRFASIAEVVMRVRGDAPPGQKADVIDIGCGAGAQSRFWSDCGHTYLGVDINEALVRLARERAAADGRPARFEVSSATKLPFPDASFDVRLVPELLEHIAEWEASTSCGASSPSAGSSRPTDSTSCDWTTRPPRSGLWYTRCGRCRRCASSAMCSPRRRCSSRGAWAARLAEAVGAA